MDTVTAIIVVLLIFAAFLLASSVMARQHAETRLTLRRLEAKVDRLLTDAGLETTEDLAEVHRAVAAGEKIRAIKAYREATGTDLATAKSAVERMQRGESPH